MLDLSRSHEAHVAWRLMNAPVAWFGTTRPDGRPHHVPVWYAWEDPTALVFSPTTAEKTRNVRVNPACTLAPESADFGQDIVILEGHAELRDMQDRLIETARRVFMEKYTPMMGDGGFDEWIKNFGQPILVQVDRIVAWNKPEGELQYHVIRR
jgi:PPOX class probable F420-dependent enzyme